MQNRNFDDGWNMPLQIYDIQNYEGIVLLCNTSKSFN